MGDNGNGQAAAEGEGGEGIAGAIWLTRKEVAERLGVTDGRLRGYTEVSTEYFGGRNVGGKGVRYPLASVEKFRQALRLTPVSFREAARSWSASPEENSNGGNGAIAVPMNQSTDPAAMVHLLAQAIRESMAEAAAPPDKLLTMQEARDEFGLSVGTLRALPHVKEGRRVLWSRVICAAKVKEIREGMIAAMLNQ